MPTGIFVNNLIPADIGILANIGIPANIEILANMGIFANKEIPANMGIPVTCEFLPAWEDDCTITDGKWKI